jgi:hypothetical protein
MSGQVFDDVMKIFQEIGIKINDEGSLVKSVYRLDGVCSYKKIKMSVTVLHYYWPHFSKIIVAGLKVPKEKIIIAYELINHINSILHYDHFKINSESGEVQLFAGFYSGMIGCEEEDDSSPLNDGMDVYSFFHLRMLIGQMITRFYLFSPLFKKLIKTNELPYTIIDEFWENISKKQRAILEEYRD